MRSSKRSFNNFLQQDSVQKAAISCFMAKNGLVHRMAMHTVQRPPQEVCNKALGYLNVIVMMRIDHPPSPSTWIKPPFSMQ